MYSGCAAHLSRARSDKQGLTTIMIIHFLGSKSPGITGVEWYNLFWTFVESTIRLPGRILVQIKKEVSMGDKSPKDKEKRKKKQTDKKKSVPAPASSVIPSKPATKK